LPLLETRARVSYGQCDPAVAPAYIGAGWFFYMRTLQATRARAARYAVLLSSILFILPACTPGASNEEAPTDTVAAAGGPVRLTINSPQQGQTVSGPDVPVAFTLENYQVYYDSAAAKGQHIHFILDNEPYIPHYSTDPFTFKEVKPGTHTIRAFPSRPWHESIKDPEAFAMVTFNVQRADGKNTVDPAAPLLTYSRPKGEYAGASAESILVDFWIKNVTLSPGGNRVRLTVDGTAEELPQWAPTYKVGLGLGEHTFRLDLLAPDGSVVAGPFNSTQRKIVLKADTLHAAHH
jgi:hypothetical protein